MAIFTNKTFSGHYPVGTAAVVCAENQEDAAQLLNGYLAGMGLVQDEPVVAEQMVRLDEKKLGVRVLCDGNY